jgi:hypothetical protein
MARMSSFSSWVRPSTYFVDPTNPISSATYHMNRRLFRGVRSCSAKTSAISRIPPEPLPLSLIPGPAGTLSR